MAESRSQVRPASVLAALKRETRAAHEAIERVVDVPASFSCQHRYRELLGRFYGFHAAWEEQAEAAIADPAFCRPRRKLPLLVRDLVALGLGDRVGSLPICPSVAPMRTRAAAIGSMYVLEGSTLGGTLLAKAAERRLGLSAAAGCAYFRSYGPNVGPMWKSFCLYAEGAVAPSEHEAAVDSALSTFASLQGWLCERVAA